MTLVDTFGADFTATNLMQTSWGESRIANVDLGSTRLLGAALWASCSIGVDVLARSYASARSGTFAEVERFFRTCGVPDEVLLHYAEHGATPVSTSNTGLHERLDELRRLLEAHPTNHPDVREMLLDQGAVHIRTKDRKLLQTRLQRVGRGIAAEFQRRTVGTLGSVIQEEVAEGMRALLGGDHDGDT